MNRLTEGHPHCPNTTAAAASASHPGSHHTQQPTHLTPLLQRRAPKQPSSGAHPNHSQPASQPAAHLVLLLQRRTLELEGGGEQLVVCTSETEQRRAVGRKWLDSLCVNSQRMTAKQTRHTPTHARLAKQPAPQWTQSSAGCTAAVLCLPHPRRTGCRATPRRWPSPARSPAAGRSRAGERAGCSAMSLLPHPCSTHPP